MRANWYENRGQGVDSTTPQQREKIRAEQLLRDRVNSAATIRPAKLRCVGKPR